MKEVCVKGCAISQSFALNSFTCVHIFCPHLVFSVYKCLNRHIYRPNAGKVYCLFDSAGEKTLSVKAVHTRVSLPDAHNF